MTPVGGPTELQQVSNAPPSGGGTSPIRLPKVSYEEGQPTIGDIDKRPQIRNGDGKLMTPAELDARHSDLVALGDAARARGIDPHTVQSWNDITQHDKAHADEALSKLYAGSEPIDEKAVKALFRSPKNYSTDNVTFSPGQADVFKGPHGEEMLIWKDMKNNFHVRTPVPEGQKFLGSPDENGKSTCHEWRNGKDIIQATKIDQERITGVSLKFGSQGDTLVTVDKVGLGYNEHLMMTPVELLLRYQR